MPKEADILLVAAFVLALGITLADKTANKPKLFFVTFVIFGTLFTVLGQL